MAVDPIRYLTRCVARDKSARDVRAVLEGLVQEVQLEEECVDAALWQDAATHGAYVLVEHWLSREGRAQFYDALREAGVIEGLDDLLDQPAETRAYLQLT